MKKIKHTDNKNIMRIFFPAEIIGQNGQHDTEGKNDLVVLINLKRVTLLP